MFDNLDEQKLKIPTQKKIDGKIAKKKSGRPRAPEKGKYHFKMPITLHNTLRSQADQIGVSISSFVCMAVQEKIDKAGKE